MINTSSVVSRFAESQLPIQKMEIAARNVDKSLTMDCNAPKLTDLMNVNPQTGSTASGLIDHDYPSLNGLPVALSNMPQIKCISSVALPPEIVDHFSRILFLNPNIQKKLDVVLSVSFAMTDCYSNLTLTLILCFP